MDAVSCAVSATSHKPTVTTFSRHEKPVCGNCGKVGHESASCFKLIGYPDWWGSSRGNNKMLGKRRGGSSNMGLNTRGKGVLGSANAANAINHSMPQSNTSGPLTTHDRATLAPDISPSVIGMPNGDCTQASQEGSVFFNGHDRTSRMVIGAGEQHRGSYDVSVSPTPASHHPVVYDNDSGVDLSNNDLVREGQPEVGEFTVRGSSRDLISTENTSGSSDISSPLEFGEHREPVNHHTEPSVRRSERVH
ncbi:hypothetical protein Salat_0866400 [Sesamum alatum]|uniref:CCHC-type domain-containing protein n=1 Tax=Sesamum alatum TaxID=300844 RepID=A0AAE2CR16_9LAMI|nr:hypothetical protein Salat_0866400 [Sesamum alatum]